MDAEQGPDERYLRFPPHQRNILLPVRPRRALARGMSLYTACKPVPLAAQYTLWGAAKVGARWLPDHLGTSWAPPMPAAEMIELRASWASGLGWRPDALAIYERIQPGRTSLTTLVMNGHHAALVRSRRSKSSLRQEQAISVAAERMGLTCFRVPRIVAEGMAAGWNWIAYEPISRAPHRPVKRLRGETTQEIRELVESAVPRPADTPDSWRGAHRDLTPWNLRRGAHRVWLIDWEDAGWAPHGADDVYFRAVVQSISRGPATPLVLPEEHREAAAYWAGIVKSRSIAAAELKLKTRLLAALRPA